MTYEMQCSRSSVVREVVDMVVVYILVSNFLQFCKQICLPKTTSAMLGMPRKETKTSCWGLTQCTSTSLIHSALLEVQHIDLEYTMYFKNRNRCGIVLKLTVNWRFKRIVHWMFDHTEGKVWNWSALWIRDLEVHCVELQQVVSIPLSASLITLVFLKQLLLYRIHPGIHFLKRKTVTLSVIKVHMTTTLTHLDADKEVVYTVT